MVKLLKALDHAGYTFSVLGQDGSLDWKYFSSYFACNNSVLLTEPLYRSIPVVDEGKYTQYAPLTHWSFSIF